MKKLFWLIGVVGIVSLIFWVGYSLGESSYLKDIVLGEHYVTDELISLTENILLIEKISDGKIDEVINKLNSDIDGDILYVDRSLPMDENIESRKIANYIFRRVAKYRQKYPRDNSEKKRQESVDKILIRVKDQVESQ